MNTRGNCILINVLTKGIKKWLTDDYGRGTAEAFSKRFIAWDTPEFPDKPRPGAPVAPTGLAHLEGRDAGEGDIDDQHARPALGGPHVAHLQGHGAFHMAGDRHAGHGGSGRDDSQPPLLASAQWFFPASSAGPQELQLPKGLALGPVSHRCSGWAGIRKCLRKCSFRQSLSERAVEVRRRPRPGKA